MSDKNSVFENVKKGRRISEDVARVQDYEGC